MRIPLPVVRTAVLIGSRPLGPPTPLRLQRLYLETQARLLARTPAGTRVEQVVLDGRPAERVTSASAPGAGPTVLWVHGGAFWTGSPRTHRVLAAHLAAATGGRVLVPDYRLAPEHPHPAAVDDARAALTALSADGPVVLGGDSAGGAIALLLAQALRDDAGAVPATPMPAALVLVSPLVDLTRAESDAYRGPDPVVRRGWARDGTRAYLGGADAAELSPLTRGLHGLPPALVQTSSDERLRAEGASLVDGLRAAGTEVTSEVLEGLWHDVHLQSHLVPEGAAAVRRMGAWIREQVRA